MTEPLSMQSKIATFIQRNSFWLVLFCHCLIFSGVSFEWAASAKLLKTKDEDRPSLFIPSYLAHNESTKTLQQQSNPAPPQETAPPNKVSKTVPTSKIGIEKPVVSHARPSFNTSQPINISRSPETEPVHLIGDKKIDRPLLTLLGKALTRYLIYPKSALDLNVKGTSVIGFVLYPDGHVTDVQLLRTSSAEVLDDAALSAARAISPVNHVSQYLDKPKLMVIGIIFE